MYAKNLELLLSQLIGKSDITQPIYADMERRFSSLRSFGRLPRGRENRERALTEQEIAAAVLGLATAYPGWAGTASIILCKLRPVGGAEASFRGAATLSDALASLLQDPNALESMVSLTVSASESGTNSHGFARLTYEDADGQRSAHFVPPEAVSFLSQGAEAHFDPSRSVRHASYQLTLDRQFFRRLVREIASARRTAFAPGGDGSEYDAEDAAAARRERLGITSSSRFVHIGADNQVTWPLRETLVRFGGHTLVLLPKTRESVQSIHIDLDANRLSGDDAITLANRFLSVLSWYDDSFAIARPGWSGSPIPVEVPKHDLAFSTARHWFLPLEYQEDPDARKAMALYREAHNAQESELISYAIISYFKIIEIRNPSVGNLPHVKEWIEGNFAPAIADDPENPSLERLRKEVGATGEAAYLFEQCRNAVAHTSIHTGSDPDDAGESRRLSDAAEVMRILARHFMRVELGLSDH